MNIQMQLSKFFYIKPNSLSGVTEQLKSFKIQQLPLLSRELGLKWFYPVTLSRTSHKKFKSNFFLPK